MTTAGKPHEHQNVAAAPGHRAPQAVICLDPFHVVVWAMKALDKVRVRTMTKAGIRDRHAMWATGKNPPDLTCEQRTSLAEIAATNSTLYQSYLLKEQLCQVFRVKGKYGRQLLAGWLSWASHTASRSSSRSPAASAATASWSTT
ncbi:MAG TPA: transposase, partial [Mycobacterium sp.]|nr:transposase [Mycobacterium sp.]